MHTFLRTCTHNVQLFAHVTCLHLNMYACMDQSDAVVVEEPVKQLSDNSPEKPTDGNGSITVTFRTVNKNVTYQLENVFYSLVFFFFF